MEIGLGGTCRVRFNCVAAGGCFFAGTRGGGGGRGSGDEQQPTASAGNVIMPFQHITDRFHAH